MNEANGSFCIELTLKPLLHVASFKQKKMCLQAQLQQGPLKTFDATGYFKKNRNCPALKNGLRKFVLVMKTEA